MTGLPLLEVLEMGAGVRNGKISLVVPVHNEQANIGPLLLSIENSFGDLPYEVVFVDDGSTDGSWSEILKQTHHTRRVRGLRLSRNFGHQVALSAGLRNAVGDAVITLDADLQDPPAVAREMVGLWSQGYEVVEARRTDRLGETWFKRGSAHVYYRILLAAASQPLPVDVGDFRLLSRKAVDTLVRLPERELYLRGMVAWLGLPRAEVEYVRPARHSGRTSFSLTRMLGLATTGIVNCTDLPLRLTGVSAAVCLILGITAVLTNLAILGGAKSTLTLLGCSLIQVGVTFAVGAICIAYLSRIANECRGRPLYLFADRTPDVFPCIAEENTSSLSDKPLQESRDPRQNYQLGVFEETMTITPSTLAIFGVFGPMAADQ